MGKKYRIPRIPVCPHCQSSLYVKLNKKIVIRGNATYECVKCGELLSFEGGVIPPIEKNRILK